MTLDRMSEGKPDDGSGQVSIIEGMVKFRDGKKWKSRWCVMRKLSPVADCIHLQLYRDAKERQRNGQTKASLSLQQYVGMESGFTLDKESNTLALVCKDLVAVLAFPAHESLLQWRVRSARQLGESYCSSALVALAPARSRVQKGPVRVHVRANHSSPAIVALTSGLPPKMVAVWDVADLRRYGLMNGRLCFEVGTRGGKLEGAWALLADKADKLVEVLAASSSGSRTSLLGGDGARKQLKLKVDKRLSDMNESSEMLDSSQSWNLDQMSEAESSIGFGDSASVIDIHISKHNNSDSREIRPSSMGRCMSCMSHLGAAATPSGASTASGTWTITDSLNEMRPETDRSSLYSRSSGGTSEYSVPKSFLKDCNMSSKSVSPVCPLPTGMMISPRGICTCHCARAHKSFSGPYENYDVPKNPMPLIKEYPLSPLSIHKSNSNYDVPKNLKKCLIKDVKPCVCSNHGSSSSIISRESPSPIENIRKHLNSPVKKLALDLTITEEDLSSSLNYVNIEPTSVSTPMKVLSQPIDDLSTILDEFESSAQILRSAGFSQEEIDGLEDIPENEPLTNTLTNKNSSDKTFQNQEMSCDSQDNKSDSVAYKNFESLEKSHNLSFSENSKLTRRKSSSADFLKKAEEFFDMTKSNSHKDMSTDSNLLNAKNRYKNTMLENFVYTEQIRTTPQKNKPVKPDKPEKPSKPDTTFLSKFKDSVKIRRSSSAPSKSEKNRDSSSSSDSGVSTGSLKYHKYDMTDLEIPITKQTGLTNLNQKTMDYSPISITSTTSDPMQQISFKFHEQTNIMKSGSFDAGTILRRPSKGLALDNCGVRSPSSCGSETSDFLETMSSSSLSSNETSNRCMARPRSGREYSTIQNTLRRQNTCDHCCQIPQEI